MNENCSPIIDYLCEQHFIDSSSNDKMIKSNERIDYYESLILETKRFVYDDYDFEESDYDGLEENDYDDSEENEPILFLAKSEDMKMYHYYKKIKNKKLFNNPQINIIDWSLFLSSKIESIVITKDVTVIYDHAFDRCSNLKSIEFARNSKLVSIGSYSFAYTSISRISIPDRVKTIKNSAFLCCYNLKYIKFTNESSLVKICNQAFSYTSINEICIPNSVIELHPYWCISMPQLTKIKISTYNPNFINIRDRILIGKLKKNSDNYDVLCFVSREIEKVFIPSSIKCIKEIVLSNHTELQIIEIDDSKYKIIPFLSDYKYTIELTNNKYIQNIYSKFKFKYYIFKESETNVYNVMISLFFYLVNFRFIVFDVINQCEYLISPKSKSISPTKKNCIFCIEEECLIIEQVDKNLLNDLIDKLKQYQVSIIDISKNANNSNIIDDIKEEISSFRKEFAREIKSNNFVNCTINSIACYLIRRYFYPSNYFIDKSFFFFGSSQSRKEFEIKRKINDFLFDENETIELETITEEAISLIESEDDDLKNQINEFYENDFIVLRHIYYKSNGDVYKFVFHRPSFYVFMMKQYNTENINTKEFKREISFCQYSHRSITQFYGFLMKRGSIIGIVYEFMSKGSLDLFIKNNQISDANLLITVGRIFDGINYLHENGLIHRDLKPSNILINHDNLAFISDFETVRSISLTDGDFTKNIGAQSYSSPEQDKGEILSYSTDIYSFGLIIYYMLERKNMIKNYEDKKTKCKPITKGPAILQQIYEKCSQYFQNERITCNEINVILNEEFNLFKYFNEYLLDKKLVIDDNKINDFIFRIMINIKMKNNNMMQIYQYKQLFLYKLQKNKPAILFNIGILYEYGYGVKQDYLKVKEYYENSSNLNNSDALNRLGKLYENGHGVKQDYLKAKEYYENAADVNNSDALNNLGELYANGYGVQQDYLKAIKYYEKSTKLGNSAAMNNLGIFYAFGFGGKQDYMKAKEYYEKSAKLDNSEAMINLGKLYEKGNGVKKDYLKAKKYYEKSANLGNSYALNNLGELYANGNGVQQDYLKAKKYYEKSAELDNSFAMNNLGELYETGHGVKQNYMKAKEYYEKSAKFDNSFALNNLGELYVNGNRVEKDYLRGKYYYEKSVNLGNSYALNNLGELYANGNGVEQDYLKAKEYYEKSAEFDNSDALNNLGYLYASGFGVKQNFSIAKEYYEKSANLNNSYAMINLGELYASGNGVKQDYFKSIGFYEKASNLNNPLAYFILGKYYSEDIFYNLHNSIKYYLKSIQAKQLSFNVTNNYLYISYNDLGLIYLTILNDVEKAKEYLMESAFNEYPFGQNNFGLFNQFYLNKYDTAEHMYRRSAEHKFSLAEYNLGRFFEKENNIEESIKYYAQASEHVNEPLTYRNTDSIDEKLEISKIFIICLANLKLTKYYFKVNEYDKSKEYFIKAMIFSKKTKYPFKFKIENELQNEHSKYIFMYLKKYIFNFPLFNLSNQPSLNINPYLYIFNNNSDIQKVNDSNIKSDNQLNSLNLSKKEQVNVKEDLKGKSLWDYNSKYDYFSNNLNGHISLKEEIRKNERKQNTSNKTNHIILNKLLSNSNEYVFDDPGKLFDFIIQNKKQNSKSDESQKEKEIGFISNMSSIFINEIQSIINLMESFLYTPPYSILFGRICTEKRKEEPEKSVDSKKEITESFYEGFEF